MCLHTLTYLFLLTQLRFETYKLYLTHAQQNDQSYSGHTREQSTNLRHVRPSTTTVGSLRTTAQMLTKAVSEKRLLRRCAPVVAILCSQVVAALLGKQPKQYRLWRTPKALFLFVLVTDVNRT